MRCTFGLFTFQVGSSGLITVPFSLAANIHKRGIKQTPSIRMGDMLASAEKEYTCWGSGFRVFFVFPF